MSLHYEPLTPELRGTINDSISNSLTNLETCESNALVVSQKVALQTLKRLINGLPDGYPMPMSSER